MKFVVDPTVVGLISRCCRHDVEQLDYRRKNTGILPLIISGDCLERMAEKDSEAVLSEKIQED